MSLGGCVVSAMAAYDPWADIPVEYPVYYGLCDSLSNREKVFLQMLDRVEKIVFNSSSCISCFLGGEGSQFSVIAACSSKSILIIKGFSEMWRRLGGLGTLSLSIFLLLRCFKKRKQILHWKCKNVLTYAGLEPAISRFVVWRLIQFGQ
jgi:hypothetical protein